MTPSVFSDPQKPTSAVLPASVTTTCPGWIRSLNPRPLLPILPNQMPCALTISSVVSSFHIGVLAGTQRSVSAAPQNFMPSQSGRISWLTRPMLK